MIKGVIFDMDGLMFDTERLSNLGWEYLIKTFDLKITMDTIDSMRGLNNKSCREVFERQETKIKFDEADDIVTAYLKGYIKAMGVPIKEGLLKLLQFLRNEGIKAAVATSSSKLRAYDYLKDAEVLPFFEGIVYGEDIKNGKPAPDIFLKAVSLLRLDACECLALEDSENGLKSAIAAGCKSAYVKDVCPVMEKIIKQADLVCDTLSEVIPYLERM